MSSSHRGPGLPWAYRCRGVSPRPPIVGGGSFVAQERGLVCLLTGGLWSPETPCPCPLRDSEWVAFAVPCLPPSSDTWCTCSTVVVSLGSKKHSAFEQICRVPQTTDRFESSRSRPRHGKNVTLFSRALV